MVTGSDDQQARLTPLHPCFGVSVQGSSFPPQDSLDEASAQWLGETLDKNSLLVFPAASISIRQQVQFSRALDSLEVANSGLSDDRYGRHISNLSNVDADGSVVAPTDNNLKLCVYGVINQLSGAGSKHPGQWIGIFDSITKLCSVTVFHGGVSHWLVCCLVTTFQPDTPPSFNLSNTRFSYNSKRVSHILYGKFGCGIDEPVGRNG